MSSAIARPSPVLQRRRHFADGLYVAALVAVIAAAWCVATARTSAEAWQVPVVYSGDALYVLGAARAYQEGELQPFGRKAVRSLGAPATADWSDWPQSEDLLFAAVGWLGRLIGLYPAANAMVLLCHVLAGLALYLAGRILHYRRAPTFTAAVLFGCSPYLFARSLNHLVLTWCWFLPFVLVVSWWALRPHWHRVQTFGLKWWIATGTSVAAGLFNVYYLNVYLQLLGLAVAFHLTRRHWRQAVFPLIQGTIAVLGFVVVQADWIVSMLTRGYNPQAVVRSLSRLELYSLELPALFLPRWHRIEAVHLFANFQFHKEKLLPGETGSNSNYLGIVAAVGLAFLLGTLVFRVLQGRFRKVPASAWQAVWILAYSLAGGLNLVLGVAGLLLFRGGNRFSIVLMLLGLFTVARTLSRRTPRRVELPLALALVCIGLYDQVPVAGWGPASTIAAVSEEIGDDRFVARRLEQALDDGAAVFQLPVAPFPEAGVIHQMSDYSHLRLFINSREADLRYSYGNTRGRETWQQGLAELGPRTLLGELDREGFSALVIDRRGYPHGAAGIIEALAQEISVQFSRGPYTVFLLAPEHRDPTVGRRRELHVEFTAVEPSLESGWGVPRTSGSLDYRFMTEPVATVYLPLEKGDYDLEVQICNAVAPELIASLRASVGDERLALQRWRRGRFTGAIDARQISEHGATVLRFEVDREVLERLQRERNPNLGLGFDRVSVEPR